MKIELGGEYSGKKILEALRRAASKLALPEKKWVVEELPHREENINRYEVRDGRLELMAPDQIGLAIYPQYLVEKRKGLFFGKKVKLWEKDAEIVFVATALNPTCKYKEIAVQIEIAWYREGIKYYTIIDNLENKKIKDIRPDFEKLFSSFVETLHSS